MKKKFRQFFLLIAIIIVFILEIVVFMSLRSEIKHHDPGMMKVLDFLGIEIVNQGFLSK